MKYVYFIALIYLQHILYTFYFSNYAVYVTHRDSNTQNNGNKWLYLYCIKAENLMGSDTSLVDLEKRTETIKFHSHQNISKDF